MAFSRIVNSDFLCYQVYESDEGQAVSLFAAPSPCKTQLMRKLKKPTTSSTSSP